MKVYDLTPRRLNLGCGRNPIDGFVNLDRQNLPGVDVVHDLEQFPLPFYDDTFDEILGVDLIEHVSNALGLMEELWRIAKPGALCTFILPYGSSDDAWEDPTHVRPYFVGSWRYFAQPIYYRADYGYRGDWECAELILEVSDTSQSPDELMQDIQFMRNIVLRQEAHLVCQKPARPADPSMLSTPRVLFRKFGG